MDDTEDDARYPPNPYPPNYHQRQKLPVRNAAAYNQPIGNDYDDDDEDEDDEEVELDEQQHEEEDEDEEDEEEEEIGGQKVKEEADDDEIGENGVDADEDEDGDGDNDGHYEDRNRNDYGRRTTPEEEEEDDLERHRKKRKFKNLGYEFAPRVTPAAAAAAAATPPTPAVAATVTSLIARPAFNGGRSAPAEWTESATFVLLDAWGDRFVQLGRKSLRSDEWHEVAKVVSQGSRTVRTDTQCRNRLDTLKKKYKKEKLKMAETGESESKWVFFKKMDELLSSSPRPGLSCGVDSGEYVFMNPRDYLNRSNGLDEMKDSPGISESSEHDEDDSDGLPPKRTKFVETKRGGSSFRLLADSIQKFGEIYEKIENNKRQQMVELEKMRMEFHRDLEMQRRKIMERAHAEIAKIRQGDDEDIDVSTENTSG